MTWTEFVESWWKGLPPRLLQSRKLVRRAKPVPLVSVIHAQVQHVPAIIELWSRWFSQSSKARCFYPAQALERAMREKEWDVLLAVHVDGRILGTVVKRWLPRVKIQGVLWPRIGVVDFFCVLPAWRNKGVGRLLLTTAHNELVEPLTPMLLLWEGFQWRQPAVCSGFFWMRKREMQTGQVSKLVGEDASRAWANCVKGGCVVSEGYRGVGLETSVWNVGDGAVVIWDTFHRSIPEGYRICIVMAWTSEEAVDRFVEGGGHGWDVCLCARKVSEQWTLDSPFQWIGYNLQTGFQTMEFPCLCF